MVYYEPSNPVNFFPTDPTFALDNVKNGVGFRAISDSVLAVPMNNPQMDKIRTRQADQYPSVLTTPGRGTRNSQTQWTLFLQQKIEIIPDRLTFVGSTSKFNYFNESEPVSSPAPATLTATVQRQHAFPYGLGLVFYPIKNVAIYATQRTTLGVQTSRLIDGSITPPQEGKLREIGIKTDFKEGKYSATFSVYENNLTNVAVATGLFSPVTNLSYSVLIGKTDSRGIDLNLAIRPISNWQVMISANKSEVTDRFGQGGLPATNKGAWGVWTRCDFTSDALKKFAVGGGANRFYDRWITASTMRLPDASRQWVSRFRQRAETAGRRLGHLLPAVSSHRQPALKVECGQCIRCPDRPGLSTCGCHRYRRTEKREADRFLSVLIPGLAAAPTAQFSRSISV